MLIINENEMIQYLNNAKNVLLVEPNYPSDYPPLGLAKIKSYLNSKGIKSTFSRKMEHGDFDLICITSIFTYYSKEVLDVIKDRGIIHAETPTILGGVLASILPDLFSKFRNLFVFKGYSKILDMVKPDYEIIDKNNQWCDYSFLFTSRGCPNKCLGGNTIINTVLGDIPIKDLVGKKIGVYTYSPVSKEVFITDALHIRKMGYKRMVRVTFDDNTFIDCTPDHRFLTFKNGNQFVDLIEVEKQAIDLYPGESIKAIRIETLPKGYKIVTWGRRKRALQQRLVMEYKIGRKLDPVEVVYHSDEIKGNNLPDNLELKSSMKEHFKSHPEISERMKKDNPQKYCTEESYKKMGDANRGKKRSIETRLKNREHMIGENNPNYKDGKTAGTVSRIPGINHKVVSVVPIKMQMTYDMEVPETNWFFANNVLVHNCAYCVAWKIEKERVTYDNWKDLVNLDKPFMMISDNNLSAISMEHLREIIEFSIEYKKKILFNSGFDCKYITKEMAELLSTATFVKRGMRLAFDRIEEDGIFQKAIETLIAAKVPRSSMLIYTLFNFMDRPKDALYRADECKRLGIRPYPQYYRPLTILDKKKVFIGKYWTRNLGRVFRGYWSLNEIWGQKTFEEYISEEKTKRLFHLTDWDFEVWNTNGDCLLNKDSIKVVESSPKKKFILKRK